jgi:flagellar basal body-associated protein FliL
LEGKGSFFILLFIVAFLSLTLAVLAGYVFFVGGGSQKAPTAASQSVTTKKIPETEIYSQTLLDKKYFNLKSTDSAKLSVLEVSMKVSIYKGKLADTAAAKILDPYIPELKDYVSTYFSDISIEDARDQKDTKEKAKKDLLAKFNEIVPPDSKTKQKIVLSITFDDWFTQ